MRESEREEARTEGRGEPMKRYHFNVGNSTDGPVGYCASVYAESPEDALGMLRELLAGDGCLGELVDDRSTELHGGIDYLNVYFTADRVTVDDIDEEE